MTGILLNRVVFKKMYFIQNKQKTRYNSDKTINLYGVIEVCEFLVCSKKKMN